MPELDDALEQIRRAYALNVASVEQLMTFDSIILKTVEEMLERVEVDLEARSNLAAKTVNHHRTLFKNIRKNESIQAYYDTMLNQCVVLLVSHFSSAIHDALRVGVIVAIGRGHQFPVARQEFKVKLYELVPSLDDQRRLADLVIDQPGISFQDMKSVHRVFKKYLKVTTPTGAFLDDIIIGQAARHCIVHAGGRVTAKRLYQVRGRNCHRLNVALKADQPVQFERDDVRGLAESTTEYLDELLKRLNAAILGAPELPDADDDWDDQIDDAAEDS